MKYFLRLDDASDYMDIEKWKKMELLLDKYNIKPIFGIIPENQDESLISKYTRDELFWDKVKDWMNKGWIPAMHGYEHKYVTKCGGINPVNPRSEFAGLSLEEQSEKIRRGYQILQGKGITPEIFFAPSHTFDMNTLEALKKETNIRIISDTISNDVYKNGDFIFIPQQSGKVRTLFLKVVTFCYHPNTMNEKLFEELETFLKKNKNKFVPDINLEKKAERKFNLFDEIIRKLYFLLRRL